jgi:hypothetical protein
MGIWEAINDSVSGLSLALGDNGTLTLANGTSQTVRAIVSRDSAKILPDANEDGFYEIMDAAVGQYRTRIDFGSVDGGPIVIPTAVVGARIEVGAESWVVEYVTGRDTYIIKTLCRKV